MISQKLVKDLEGAVPCIQVERRCFTSAGGQVIEEEVAGFVFNGHIEVVVEVVIPITIDVFCKNVIIKT